MYINQDGLQLWQDEICIFTVGMDEEGNNIEIPAIKRETGIWISQNGVEMLVEPTEAWILENQPSVEQKSEPPTLAARLEALKQAILGPRRDRR